MKGPALILSSNPSDLFQLYPADHGGLMSRAWHYLTVKPWVGYIMVTTFIHFSWVYLLLATQVFQVGTIGKPTITTKNLGHCYIFSPLGTFPFLSLSFPLPPFLFDYFSLAGSCSAKV